MRRAAGRFKRVDANQKAMVLLLRKLGMFVCHLHEVGHGCPDLLVAFRGRWYLVEIKDGASPFGWKRTGVQKDFIADCGAPIVTLTCADEAIEWRAAICAGERGKEFFAQ